MRFHVWLLVSLSLFLLWASPSCRFCHLFDTLSHVIHDASDKNCHTHKLVKCSEIALNLPNSGFGSFFWPPKLPHKFMSAGATDYGCYFGNYAEEVRLVKEVLSPFVRVSLDLQNDLGKSHKSRQVTRKGDGSVVTVLDVAIQTMLVAAISERFPNDYVHGEEDPSKLDPDFLSEVKKLLPNGMDPVKVNANIIHELHRTDHRVWVIDPIDGTSSFVKGYHYAFCVALLVDGVVAMNVCAWPRHSQEFTLLTFDGPAIFAAAKGFGCWVWNENGDIFRVQVGNHPRKAIMHNISPKRRDMLEKQMRTLGLQYEFSFMSMAKACAVAAGGAEFYVKMQHCNQWAYDVIPVVTIVEEAGGMVRLLDGSQLTITKDFLVQNSSQGIIYTALDEAFIKKVADAIDKSRPSGYFRVVH